jgi:hypothetical protein
MYFFNSVIEEAVTILVISPKSAAPLFTNSPLIAIKDCTF